MILNICKNVNLNETTFRPFTSGSYWTNDLKFPKLKDVALARTVLSFVVFIITWSCGGNIWSTVLSLSTTFFSYDERLVWFPVSIDAGRCPREQTVPELSPSCTWNHQPQLQFVAQRLSEENRRFFATMRLLRKNWNTLWQRTGQWYNYLLYLSNLSGIKGKKAHTLVSLI